MSAEAVGAAMPRLVTLDDLAAMAAADENHRYELSSAGVLSVAPPADSDHALLVSRMFAWFLAQGYGPEQVLTACGIDVGGGRVPDLTVWAKGLPPRAARSSYASTAGLLLAIEVMSTDSDVVDRVVKKTEYADAGIPHYWFVERNGASTVHRLSLDIETGTYKEAGGVEPLAVLLTTAPDLL